MGLAGGPSRDIRLCFLSREHKLASGLKQHLQVS